MPGTTIHVCKFDPAHGTFVTPRILRQHYDTEHAGQYRPDAWNRRNWRCRMCGHELKNPTSHVHQVHHATMVDKPWTIVYFDMLDDDGNVIRAGTWTPDNGRTTDMVERLRHPVPVAHHLHTEPEPEPSWDTGTVDVDDIVIPVVTGFAHPTGMVPVAHLAAILAWRDATAAMLATVAQPPKPT